MGMTIEVTSGAIATLLGEASRAGNEECCGLLLGSTASRDRIEFVRPAANVAADSCATSKSILPRCSLPIGRSARANTNCSAIIIRIPMDRLRPLRPIALRPAVTGASGRLSQMARSAGGAMRRTASWRFPTWLLMAKCNAPAGREGVSIPRSPCDLSVTLV